MVTSARSVLGSQGRRPTQNSGCCRLAAIAATGQLNLCSISPTELVTKFFPKVFPESWKDAIEVAWDPTAPGQPSAEWMQLLWMYLQVPASSVLSLDTYPSDSVCTAPDLEGACQRSGNRLLGVLRNVVSLP